MGDRPWRFHRVAAESPQDSAADQQKVFKAENFDDSGWDQVAVPHCYNDTDTYLNAINHNQWRGTVWYRHRFRPDKSWTGKKLFLEFQGVNVGIAVYINGKFKPGNTKVEQPDEVTHVGGFLPFALDITDDVRFGEENIIAVRVSNAPHSFFTWPGFGVHEGFGMGWGGIVSPVLLYVTDKVHIPLNDYSPLAAWGNYAATISASDKMATLRVQTKVVNDRERPCRVTVRNELVDAENKIVLALQAEQVLPARTTRVFDKDGRMATPYLWYPNNSPFGKPYLYRLVSTILVDGKVVDRTEDKVGLRTISWDGNYCYVNGKRHFLQGFGNRNIYPALGSAVPESLQWEDVRLIAAAGGNALRIGHAPATQQTVAACDAYGILVVQNSGDNEWALKDEPALTYKREYDRDMVIAFRNHPSIAVWESNNGLARTGKKYLPLYTQQVVDQWDSLQPRIIENRDAYPDGWPRDTAIMVGYTNRYRKVTGSPSINMEVYGNFGRGKRSMHIARFDYGDEKVFTDWYVKDYKQNQKDSACGWIDWMLAETEDEGGSMYLNGKVNNKSLGSCAMDGNRFPKLIYRVFRNALWIDYRTHPGVALQSTWYPDSVQTIDAWSNCPAVALFFNGKLLGTRIPDSLTKRCTWENLHLRKGTLLAAGLDDRGHTVATDTRRTAGAPHRIELMVEPQSTRPDGTSFQLKANGSDVALITARVVDEAGNLCAGSGATIDFEVIGEGNFRGSYNIYVTDGRPLGYHSPGDRQLQAEGGLMRIAVRTTFRSGKVTVIARSPGLMEGRTSFTTQRLR